MTVMTPELKFKILAVSFVALLFISGLGIGQVRRDMKIAQITADQNLGSMSYELGIHDKLLDRYGDKIEAIDQRTIRLESSVDSVQIQMAWFTRILGACLIGILTALGGTVYRRVVEKRQEMSLLK